MPERPNIILLVADDNVTDALGCYGNPVVHTPHLDRLAAEGARFTNAYCTSASCSASRSVILTGRFNHSIGHYGHEHDYHHFSGKKPFFLYFCFDDPHRGHPFQSDPWNLPNNFGNTPGGYPGEDVMTYTAEDVIIPPFLPDTRETREELAEYYQLVARTDQGIGRLLEILEASGKMDNTIIIYISDNGIAFPGAKTTLYDPGIRLPLIVWTLWMQKGDIVNNAMVSWSDLTPTILDFAGIDPTTIYSHGRSFKGIIEKEDPEGWDKIYASHTFHEITMYYPMRVIQDRQYKLIWNIAWQLPYPFASDLWAASTWQGTYRDGEDYFGKRSIDAFIHRPEFELYDMVYDPDEVVNLASDPAHSELLESMKVQIRDFQLKTRDPWIIMWDNESVFQGTGVNL